MKRLLFIFVLGCCSAHAQTPWFTVVGDPADPTADTIQLNPIAVSFDGMKRTMELRISRSAERVSTDGVRFRSFQGQVEFDCKERTARFVQSQFFAEPLWTSPGKALTYPASQVRPMDFRRFEPNPKERVIRAACKGASAS